MTHNPTKMKTTISLKCRMDKEIMGYSYNEIPYIIELHQVLITT